MSPAIPLLCHGPGYVAHHFLQYVVPLFVSQFVPAMFPLLFENLSRHGRKICLRLMEATALLREQEKVLSGITPPGTEQPEQWQVLQARKGLARHRPVHDGPSPPIV